MVENEVPTADYLRGEEMAIRKLRVEIAQAKTARSLARKFNMLADNADTVESLQESYNVMVRCYMYSVFLYHAEESANPDIAEYYRYIFPDNVAEAIVAGRAFRWGKLSK